MIRDHVSVMLPISDAASVLPASEVLALAREPRIADDQWDAEFRKSEWAATVETLEEWGDAMVEVRPLGMAVGQFQVQLFTISWKQYLTLIYARMA